MKKEIKKATFSEDDQLREAREIISNVLKLWCPVGYRTESVEHQMLRALFQVNAYGLDLKRIQEGKTPIRTLYPIPLPKPGSQFFPVEVNYVPCPLCGGQGRRSGGTSAATQEAERYGYNNSFECQCCSGSGRVREGTNPDWWRPSDLGGR